LTVTSNPTRPVVNAAVVFGTTLASTRLRRPAPRTSGIEKPNYGHVAAADGTTPTDPACAACHNMMDPLGSRWNISTP